MRKRVRPITLLLLTRLGGLLLLAGYVAWQISVHVQQDFQAQERQKQQQKQQKQQQLNAALLQAIKENNTAAALTALHGGADPNAKDYPTGLGVAPPLTTYTIGTPLLVEGMKGYENPTIIKALVSKGADVNARDIEGMTVLMHAVGYQHASTVKILLEKGADVHAKDNAGHTVQWWAAGPDHVAVVRLLNQAGARK